MAFRRLFDLLSGRDGESRSYFENQSFRLPRGVAEDSPQKDLISSVRSELININTILNKIPPTLPSNIEYRSNVDAASLKLMEAVDEGTPDLIIKAGQNYIKVARSNTDGWNLIAKLAIGVVGTVFIVGLMGYALPTTALLGLKFLCTHTFFNAALPAVSSTLATEIAIGTGTAASLIPLSKFYGWLLKATPQQEIINTADPTLRKLEIDCPKPGWF